MAALQVAFDRKAPAEGHLYSAADELDRLVSGDRIDAGKASRSNCSGLSYEVMITVAPSWPQ